MLLFFISPSMQLKTPFQICLAPLRGLTDSTYRNVYARFFSGIDWAITPFLTTLKGSRIKPSHLKEVLPENNTGMAVVPQIIGNCAEDFILLANALFDLGYTRINWNLGCPFPRVAKKRRGAGLLPYPELVTSFLDRVIPACRKGSLGIKMRLGYHDVREIYTLLPLLDRYPLGELIIHPRTGKQMYKGLPEIECFERCLSMTRHTVIYNGDIVTKNDFKQLTSRFPAVKTWMIGRGVLYDPFLPSRIKGTEPPDDNKVEKLQLFHDALFDEYEKILFGPAHLLNKMKGFWFYFAHAFEDGQRILKLVRKTTTKDHYKTLISDLFKDAVCSKRGTS